MNWCFWTVMSKKTLESPLDCKEIQPVHPKGNQSWILIGRTDAEAETPIFWPPNVKNWLIGKDPDAGKDWGQEEKGTIEDEMVGWHHRLHGHEFEQASGDAEGQGKPAILQSIGSQRAGHDWATEQQQTTLKTYFLRKDFLNEVWVKGYDISLNFCWEVATHCPLTSSVWEDLYCVLTRRCDCFLKAKNVTNLTLHSSSSGKFLTLPSIRLNWTGRVV